MNARTPSRKRGPRRTSLWALSLTLLRLVRHGHSRATPTRPALQLPANGALRGLLSALIFIAMLGAVPVGQAAVVAEVSVDEMLVQADLVFEGRVLSRQARRVDEQRIIRTFVTFAIIEIVKGVWSAETIELSFLGGVINGRGMRVAGMVIPEVGERGIYFVESPTRALIQPFYGWTQGEFRVLDDPAGTARVVTRSGKPVREVQPGAQAPLRTLRQRALSNGTARGITTGPPTSISDAMTPRDFKSGLRERLRDLQQ